MGNSTTKFKRALQNDDEVTACLLYVQHPDIRETLDPNASYGENAQHNTALHYACKYAMKSLLRDFLLRGGNPNKTNANGETALHSLMTVSGGVVPKADRRRMDCIYLLLKWRGGRCPDGSEEQLKIEALNKKNQTALHCAAASGLFYSTQTLVTYRCPLFHEDADGFTACDIAEQCRNGPIAAYLESKMVFSETISDDAVDEIALLGDEEEYSGLCAQDLQEVKDQLIVETSDMLKVPLFTAEALLRKHEWSREKLLETWMEDPSLACKRAGVNLPKEHPLIYGDADERQHVSIKNGQNKSRLRIECNVCDDFISSNEKPPEIPCGHNFCKSCWERYLCSKIVDGSTQNIQCPGFNCTVLVPVETIEVLISREMARKYLHFDLKAFVDSNPELKWCPFPGCGQAVKLPQLSSSRASASFDSLLPKSVDCGKGHYFCWICLGESHEPCSCEVWKRWKVKVEEMSPEEGLVKAAETETVASSLWLVTNSKSCPSCRSPIQKNEGCNHISCTKCKHDFCWICLEPWKLHSSETGGYFRCNRREVVDKVEEKHREEKEKIEQKHSEMQAVNEFLHYYSKYRSHESNFKLESKFLDAVKEKVADLQLAAKRIDGKEEPDASFLEDGIKELLKSRQILKGSFPYAYYMENDRGQKTIFEFMQEEVEHASEKVSSMIVRPYLKTPRSQIIQATKTLKRKRQEFLTAIDRGLVPPDDEDAFYRSCQFSPSKQRHGKRKKTKRTRHQRLEMLRDRTSELRFLIPEVAHPSLESNSESEMERNLEELEGMMEMMRQELQIDTSTEEINVKPKRGSRAGRSVSLDQVDVSGLQAGTSRQGQRASSSRSVRSVEHCLKPGCGHRVPSSVVSSNTSQFCSRTCKDEMLFSSVLPNSTPDSSSGRSDRDSNVMFIDDCGTSSDSEDQLPVRRYPTMLRSRVLSATASSPMSARSDSSPDIDRPKAVVLFDFNPESNTELKLEAGDVIEILDQRMDGWWRGRTASARGLFPSTFVHMLPEDSPTKSRYHTLDHQG